MRTPEGRECPYYYSNTHRRVISKESCRLLEGKPDAQKWSSALCATCEVPDIRRANGCKKMILHARIAKRPWRFWEKERVLIHATCTRSAGPVENPYSGCGQCHQNITFVVAESAEE